MSISDIFLLRVRIYSDCFERVEINIEPCVSLVPQEF
jgi:hypothetical protein